MNNEYMQQARSPIYLFTDGASSGNPGPGGYGVVLKCAGREMEMSEGFSLTTNNRMELTAVISALSALNQPCQVTVTTDSKYVCDAINQGWVYSWKKNGWRKADKKPALNPDLWGQLLELLEKHQVTFKWVKGHNEHPENERCDRLAVAECEKYK